MEPRQPNDQTRDLSRDLDRDQDRVEVTPNADPITGEPGAHPVGTGIGAAAAGAAATAIGATAGPIGAVVGAVVGSVIGGLVGKSAAETTNPTVEEGYWRSSHTERTYAQDRPYETYHLAYQVGYEGYLNRTGQQTQQSSFRSAEPELRREYEQQNNGSGVDWNEARYAVEDAWNRAKRNDFFYQEDLYWREHYQRQPYYNSNLSYQDYQLAYRTGYEGFVEYGHQNQHFDQVEHVLRDQYDMSDTASVLPWQDARHAVFDGWHRAAQRFYI